MNTNQINDECVLIEYEGTAELTDGTRRPIELPITARQVREYLADPNPCQCADCKSTFGMAAKILRLQGDLLERKLTKAQLERK